MFPHRNPTGGINRDIRSKGKQEGDISRYITHSGESMMVSTPLGAIITKGPNEKKTIPLER